MTFILKNNLPKDSQNYPLLRQVGLQKIEELGRQFWTDYNVHDPGVSFLEQLCYAITDLGYRTDFEIKDLLTESENGVAVINDNFHSALDIFPNCPVTFKDLRKCLIDIRGVRNAWISKHKSIQYCLDEQTKQLKEACDPNKDSDVLCEPLNGLFDVLLVFEDFVIEALKNAVGGLPNPKTGGAMNANNQGLQFTANQDFTLTSIDIYAYTAGDLEIQLLDENDVLIFSKTFQNIAPGNLQTLELNWDIPTGTNWQLRGSGAGLKLSQENIPNFSTTPISIDNVLQITRGIASTGSLNNQYHFFYNWVINYLPTHLPQSSVTRADVRAAVHNKLHEVRNFCEDFIKVRELEFEKIGVCADVEVSPEVNIEEVLAKIYFELENHIAPPVNFYTIQELLDKGKTTDEIFEGPVLDHGFIDHDEFCEQERRCFFRTSDIIQIIMDIPGVKAVKEISLLSFIEVPLDYVAQNGERVETLEGKKYIVKQEPWILELTDLQRFAPDFAPERSRFIFYKNDLPYIPNQNQVMRNFEDIRATHIRPKLSGHERDLPIPLGEFKDLENYYPAQNALPANYRVGIFSVPNSESSLRKAQAKQLKAYLLFFEQLLANYLSQLGHINELFSWKKTTNIQTYFTQRIEGIAGLNDIYFDYPNLQTALDNIVETTQVAEERKNRFLDHLLGRFAESFSDYSLMMSGVLGDAAAAQVIEDKQDFLDDYPAVSSARGKGFDYRHPDVPDNVLGYQRRVYRLLGIRPVERRNFAGHRFEIQPITVVENGVTIDKFQFVLKDENDDTLIVFTSIACENKEEICALLDSVLHIGANPDNWGMDGGIWKLYQFCGTESEEIGSLLNGDDALKDAVIAYFQSIANAEGFHVVEHILLRKRTTADPFLSVEIPDEGDCDCPCVKDPYSFRASIILPSWAGRFRNIRFRQYMERVLREEAPAHVYLKICWISNCEMQEFETCHNQWLQEHAALNECYRGQMPLENIADLPATEQPKMTQYAATLEAFLEKLQSLTNIFPTARLHDCETVTGDEPQISLNNTSLGSL